MSTPPVFLSTTDVAARLSVDRTTIWRWVRIGRLTPAGYVRREPFFDPAQVAALAGDDAPSTDVGPAPLAVVASNAA